MAVLRLLGAGCAEDGSVEAVAEGCDGTKDVQEHPELERTGVEHVLRW